jgi:single-stranded DNA-binding protein
MNIQVVAGRVKRVDRRAVRDKALTILWIEGFDFSILVWEAEVSAKEGDYVFAEGRIQSRSYEKDGTKRYVTEVIAHRVTNLSEGKAGNAAFAIGNLGRAPEMRYTPSGKAVTNVSLAANAYGAQTPEWLYLTCWESTPVRGY